MEKKKGSLDFLIIGLAFFATYFGAGNLVFPPKLGLQSGTSWLGGSIGLAISGIILPLLAIILISCAGGNVEDLTKHVTKNFHKVMLGVLMLICMFISIPRCGAVAAELGLQGIWSGAPYVPAVLMFFLACFLVGKSKEKLLDNIGKYLTPLMVIILFIVVIKGLINPLGAAGAPQVANPTINAVLTGYQTGDVLVSVIMASVFISTIHNKGYRKPEETNRMVIKASVIAFICLFVVYGGLVVIGASVNTEYDPSIGNAELLVDLIRRLGGQVAMSAFGVAVILACLTTAAGQLTAVADFIDTEITKGKVPFRVLLIAATLISTLVATLGLDTIIALAAPIFSLAYAPTLVLMLLGAFRNVIPHDGCWKGAMLLTGIEAGLEMLSAYIPGAGIGNALGVLPFFSLGFGWVLPAAVGFVIGLVAWKPKA